LDEHPERGRVLIVVLFNFLENTQADQLADADFFPMLAVDVSKIVSEVSMGNSV
jgi:hypothetical protein